MMNHLRPEAKIPIQDFKNLHFYQIHTFRNSNPTPSHNHSSPLTFTKQNIVASSLDLEKKNHEILLHPVPLPHNLNPI